MTERPGISLDEWEPIVAKIVPTPRTAWRKGLDIMPLAYGPEADPDGGLAREYRAVCEWTVRRGEEMGWPLFLRTGLTSGKHDWRRTCHVPDAASVPAHVSAIIEYSAMAGFDGLRADVWVAREMLPTFGVFTAFDGMPVTRERRYFVKDGRVVGHHPYWPPDALAIPRDEMWDPDGVGPTHRASVDNWRELLPLVNDEIPGETTELTTLTERVGAAVPGAWSVDWLWVHRPHTNDSGWYLTDMAWAEQSFVWSDHPTAPSPDALLEVAGAPR